VNNERRSTGTQTKYQQHHGKQHTPLPRPTSRLRNEGIEREGQSGNVDGQGYLKCIVMARLTGYGSAGLV